jgi:hypothetical protein
MYKHATKQPHCQEYEARLYRTLLPLISKVDVDGVAGNFTPQSSAVFKTVEHR